MTEFVALRAKTHSYLDYEGKEEKIAKGTKKFVVKRRIKLDDYKTCLFNDNPVLRSQEVFRSESHDVCMLRHNKIALITSDDKRLQTYDKITTYPYGISVRKVCKTELLNTVKRIN